MAAAVALAVVASTVAVGAPAFAATGGADGGGSESESAGPTEIAEYGVTVTEPGRYVIAQDLELEHDRPVSELGPPCIRVAAGDVVLDGDGHALTPGNSNVVPAILVAGNGTRLRNVTVRDVAVKYYSSVGIRVGVRYEDVTDGAVVNLSSNDNGVSVALANTSDTVVRGSEFSGTGLSSNRASSYGVLVRNGSDNAVVNNWIGGGMGAGVRLEAGSDDNRVANNHVQSYRAVSIADSDHNRVVGNLVDRADGPNATHTGVGLRGDAVGNLVADNRISEFPTGVRVGVAGTETGDGDAANVVRDNAIRTNVDGVDVVTSTVPLAIRSNAIAGAEVGVRVRSSAACAPGVESAAAVRLHPNAIANATAYGVLNEDPDAVNATRNF